jgi:hypothetical protein
MLIDTILDRRDGGGFDPVLFAFDVNDYAGIFPDLCGPVLAALSSRDEMSVKRALCGYVLAAGYDPEICDYINSVSWLPAWWDL